jgi:hypothetical protein
MQLRVTALQPITRLIFPPQTLHLMLIVYIGENPKFKMYFVIRAVSR